MITVASSGHGLLLYKTAFPAKAGIHRSANSLVDEWVPAFAGNAAVELQGAGDFLDLEALDHVADLDVLIIFEGHPAFVAFAHLADLVLEALQSLQAALVDDDVVAQQAHLGAAPHHTLGDHAAGDLPGPGDVEDLPDRRVAEELLAQHRRQHAGERVAHIVDQIV